MALFWTGLLLTILPAIVVAVCLTATFFFLIYKYGDFVARIFQEKPLFIVPRGQPIEGAEDVSFVTSDGRKLCGCYLKGTGRRRGVILFGLEFGSNRWACLPYCETLLNNGYDVFTFESRNQGDSEREPGYEPLQWVTDYEVEDTRAALAYLKSRPDADPKGVGFFGISKGAGAGLLAAARDSSVCCFATDGVFATYTTLVPYMRQWFGIYNQTHLTRGMFPSWYYGWVGLWCLRRIAKERHCHFPHMEGVLRHLGKRPVLMIHGGADAYIKPRMAQSLFKRLPGPKELWMVEGAKHNGALTAAGDEYRRRVLEFFNNHLGGALPDSTHTPSALPGPHRPERITEPVSS
jgi:pimeloyl-ACP methyl ester carboxylesterase